jgi:hypothetical protein
MKLKWYISGSICGVVSIVVQYIVYHIGFLFSLIQTLAGIFNSFFLFPLAILTFNFPLVIFSVVAYFITERKQEWSIILTATIFLFVVSVFKSYFTVY